MAPLSQPVGTTTGVSQEVNKNSKTQLKGSTKKYNTKVHSPLRKWNLVLTSAAVMAIDFAWWAAATATEGTADSIAFNSHFED